MEKEKSRKKKKKKKGRKEIKSCRSCIAGSQRVKHIFSNLSLTVGAMYKEMDEIIRTLKWVVAVEKAARAAVPHTHTV